MNPKQKARKIRERAKTFLGVVSSIKNEGLVPLETIRETIVRAQDMNLHIIAKLAHMALEMSEALKDQKRCREIADECQKEMADMQVKLTKMQHALEGGNVARIRKMSKKAKAHRPEKKGYRAAKYHPMSGYRNRNNRAR